MIFQNHHWQKFTKPPNSSLICKTLSKFIYIGLSQNMLGTKLIKSKTILKYL
jgi:hypothetical protein